MRNLKVALLGAALLAGAAVPLEAQNNKDNGTAIAAAEPAVPNRPVAAAAPPQAQNETVASDEPAVPNTPRQATPDAMAAPPLNSPDASKIDASNDKADDTADSDAANSDDTDGIVATVNDEAISDFELRQRVTLVVAMSGLKPSAEDLKRIRTQVLAQLEDEKIELQEAAKQQVTVSPAEIDKHVNQLLSDNHITIDQLRGILSNAGTSEAALRAELEVQVAWGKTVEKQYGDIPVVTPAQVDAELKRQADGANKPHYLVAEIFLPVDNPNQDSKVQKDAQSLENQLQQGAPFSALARQFSQSPDAAAGGEIGWVRQGQLAPELDAVLTKMKQNTISVPIRSNFGYYILMLHERQEPLGTHIEATQIAAPLGASGKLPLARLLLPVGTTPTKDIIDTGMKIAAQIRAGYDGCAKLAQLPKQIQGAVYSDLSEYKLSDLSGEIQKAVAATPPGEMAPPMLSEAGIELIARCDARVEVRTAFTLPTRDQVEQQLFEEQISALANRYKRDIKRDADVEVR